MIETNLTAGIGAKIIKATTRGVPYALTAPDGTTRQCQGMVQVSGNSRDAANGASGQQEAGPDRFMFKIAPEGPVYPVKGETLQAMGSTWRILGQGLKKGFFVVYQIALVE